MNTTERFRIPMLAVFTLPWLAWRLGPTEHWAPLPHGPGHGSTHFMRTQFLSRGQSSSSTHSGLQFSYGLPK